ncbi:helix-turn-helix transcriptional regulator [Lacibacter sp. MH-610]|uniref:helix-turn-helix domain-containing protein n=1 Tax=Lacibacter sp. MH-610 TaxID=3020883 RepID=UPI003892B332
MNITDEELLTVARSYAAAWNTKEEQDVARVSFIHAVRWYEAKLRQCNVMPSLRDFKLMRAKAGMTLRDVEKLTGISNAYLSQLERGKIKKPSHEVVLKLNSVYAASNGA